MVLNSLKRSLLIMKIVFKKDLELAAGVCVHLWGFLYCCPFPSFNLGNACSAKTAGQLEEFYSLQ